MPDTEWPPRAEWAKWGCSAWADQVMVCMHIVGLRFQASVVRASARFVADVPRLWYRQVNRADRIDRRAAMFEAIVATGL